MWRKPVGASLTLVPQPCLPRKVIVMKLRPVMGCETDQMKDGRDSSTAQ